MPSLWEGRTNTSKAAEVLALRLEVEKLRAEATYAQAATSIESQRDALRQMLGMEMSAPLEISTEVNCTLYPMTVSTVLSRRTDMEEAQIRNSIEKLDLELTKKRVGPWAELNASVSLRGRGEDRGDVGSTFERTSSQPAATCSCPSLMAATSAAC